MRSRHQGKTVSEVASGPAVIVGLKGQGLPIDQDDTNESSAALIGAKSKGQGVIHILFLYIFSFFQKVTKTKLDKSHTDLTFSYCCFVTFFFFYFLLLFVLTILLFVFILNSYCLPFHM